MRRHLLLLVVAALVASVPHAAWAAADPARGRQWNLDRLGADAAWRHADGTGITVAVVDSGVDLAHEDLAGRLVPGRDFVDDDDDPQDAYGHGTHVAGIIAAGRGNDRGIAGVAPGARIMPLRVLGPDGGGQLDDVVAAVRWAVRHGADVVNLSLGEDTQAVLGASFADVLDEAWEAGVVPVVAAGNQFFTGSGFSDERALVVAATTRHDTKPTYSSGVGRARWGISAPGGELPDLGAEHAILSTYWAPGAADQYAYLAGTSQAAPHVAGAVALLLSTGQFGPARAVERLLATAADIGAPGHDLTFGAGRLDLAAALDGVTAATAGPAQPPPPPRRPAAPVTTTVAPPATVEEQAVLTTTSTSTVEAPSPPVHQGRPLTLRPPGDDEPTEDKAAAATVAALLAGAVTTAALRRRRSRA